MGDSRVIEVVFHEESGKSGKIPSFLFIEVIDKNSFDNLAVFQGLKIDFGSQMIKQEIRNGYVQTICAITQPIL